LQGNPEIRADVEALNQQQFLEQLPSGGTNPERDWPDSSPLGDELPVVQDFSLEFLPSSFRPLVDDLSERMQTPLDFAGVAATVALAGCVSRRAIIHPKAIDDSWAVIPNLWGAIVAPPGFMKSPVLHSVTRPLTKIQDFWHAEYEQQVGEYERTWREQYKKADKTGKPAPQRPDVSTSQPVEKRLLLTDSTYEKLHEILSQNPAGVLVLRDELTGWLAGLDRQGHEGERAFYLQAWNGDEGFTVDRIGRGSIYLPAACVSLLGNIQPARLRSYLSDVTAGGPNDDGLFQRFQILVWPDPPRPWKNVDRKPSSSALGMAEKIFGTLAVLSAEDPIRMNFDSEAQRLFNEWHEELERLVRSERGLSPSLVGHFSKYRSLMPTLAGLFELADRVSEAKGLSGHFLITLNHAKQAAAFCDYLESHARRVYSCVIGPECRAARELARHIQAKDVVENFTTRSIYLNGWSGLDTPDRVRGALSLLEDAAWVRRIESASPPSGGRPSETWLINPNVLRHEK
jgi:putative DNA primase/helicase